MYRITVQKVVGGECVSVPVETLESEGAARARFDKIVESEKAELDAPYMRIVGGSSELYLEKVTHLFDGGDMIRNVSLRRPLNSPNVLEFVIV